MSRRRARPDDATARLLGLFGLCAAGFALMWVLVAISATHHLDHLGFQVFGVSRHSELGRHARTVSGWGTGAAVALTLLALLRLCRHRRWALAAAIVIGFPASFGIADAVKSIQSRPRPPFEILPAQGTSFPSNDAAIAVGFVLVAWVLAEGLGGRILRGGVIGLGGVAALATGLLTVTFRDHHLSDVLAGWALGGAVFSLAVLAARVSERRHRRVARPELEPAGRRYAVADARPGPDRADPRGDP